MHNGILRPDISQNRVWERGGRNHPRSIPVGLCAILAAVGIGLLAPVARAEVRIKDVTDVEGVRVNQLMGFGLVAGLNGTGGKTPDTRRAYLNLLQKYGLPASPEVREQIRTDSSSKTDNISLVVVTAELPSFARPGSRMDVLVSSIDDAKSLQGGQLLRTELIGFDGEVYAIASGPISLGGFSFSGDAGSVQKNHPTTGRIPEGATIETETCTPVGQEGFVRMLLRSPDYETARRIAESIHEQFPGIARAMDAGTVEIHVPVEYRPDVPAFIGTIGGLLVEPDMTARIVINERTGTVVIGENVRLSTVLITHANLAVITGEFPQVSQPGPFSDGATVVVPRTQLNVIEESKPVSLIEEQATVGDLARALNLLGVTPRDLSSIFQQLKESGALHAELQFK